ncbi:hypothetical protein CFT13S00388_07865 [Campylobacter fetus subsp. testudinum]|uniref:hypothetical protein n=1 Tax=Campylobacter fetus TaxID=196 RepID=UPI00081894B8|nr:hypothetical protein [Campylobacter fetus]OCR86669.1 hypothetical protein CFT13S00388_07865 [Campylobacter fetus subsp. testudinum]
MTKEGEETIDLLKTCTNTLDDVLDNLSEIIEDNYELEYIFNDISMVKNVLEKVLNGGYKID